MGRLLLLLLVLRGLPAAPSRGLRLPLPPPPACRWPRIPSDKAQHPAWLMTEMPFRNALKSWLTGKQPLLILASSLEDPPAFLQHLTSSNSGLAAWAELHCRKQHAAARRPHRLRAQLMRIGCVLGTCQVQNLRHRLWQLKGRPRGQDSSPVNPNSPHSYG
ncbi:protein ADM2 [Heteronotia binoei]|uniref:protein ADM2 n=1 Tax=Heteronotia binoei TaxID=13085 RepID=UPI0029315317|nr:protein ADM2 [Heteronotia binoei]